MRQTSGQVLIAKVEKSTNQLIWHWGRDRRNEVLGTLKLLCFNGMYCICISFILKGSIWQITQTWESDVFRLDLAYCTSIPSLEQKHSSCWKIFKSRYNDIALMSMHMTDTFCSLTRTVIFKSCFFLSEYGRFPLYPKGTLKCHELMGENEKLSTVWVN